MMDERKTRLALFTGLTVVFNVIFFIIIGTAGTMTAGGGWVVFSLMWSPGVAAMVTQLLTKGTLRGLGWGWGKTRYQLVALALPILLATTVYVLVWLTGLGGFPDPAFVEDIASQLNFGASKSQAIGIYVLISLTFSMIPSIFAALGEEIGWRGFMVPELVKWRGFTFAAFASGSFWAIWHFPGILLADYGSGVPTGYALICFSIMAIASSFVLAWLRLKSGSVWTAAFFHAAHNVVIQTILTPLTFDTGPTELFVDEFGVGMAIAYSIAAYLVWRRRDEFSSDPMGN